MYTVLLYTFNGIVSVVLAIKSYLAYKQNPNNFIAKWFVIIASINTLAYASLVLHVFFGLTDNPKLSVVADGIALSFFYVAMISGVALSGRLSDKRLLGKIIMAILVVSGFYVVLSTMILPSIPIADQNGIIIYTGVPTSTGLLVGYVFALSILLAYIWTSVIFIWAGVMNARLRIKLFLLGGGFLASTLTGASLMFTKTLTQYLVAYGLFFLSYVVIFLGVIERSDA